MVREEFLIFYMKTNFSKTISRFTTELRVGKYIVFNKEVLGLRHNPGPAKTSLVFTYYKKQVKYTYKHHTKLILQLFCSLYCLNSNRPSNVGAVTVTQASRVASLYDD